MELLTKKFLKAYFGLSLKDEHGRLRKLVFTDQVLEKIGLTVEQYKKIRTFDAQTSAQIREILKIK